MKGLDISKGYFEEYGREMLESGFSDILPYVAVGLTGSGSECFGYDDDVSRDHDFEPGFMIFLPGEDVVDRRTAFLLERAYSKLPKEYEGIKRSLMQPVGGARRGVVRTDEYFTEKVGSADGILTVGQWFSIEESALAEAVNGEIFFDNYGQVLQIRRALSHYPSDIRKKKLAGELLVMAQSGQYNYLRCIKHGEMAAAQLAVCEFVKSTINVIFLLNDVYRPYYKWSFRALRALPRQSLQAEVLEYLLTTNNDGELAGEKYDVIEGIAADIIDELIGMSLTGAGCGDLEKHAYSVNDSIQDPQIRNMHILAAVKE